MSAPGYAGNQYIVDIGTDTAAFTAILAKSTVRRLVIEESTLTSTGSANTLQGLIQYKIPNDGTADGFTTLFQAVGANDETSEGQIVPAKIELGNKVGQIAAFGEVIGQLGQPIVGNNPPGLTAATTMIQLRSGTGTGTSVMVTEYN
jgi:hypothetical protein